MLFTENTKQSWFFLTKDLFFLLLRYFMLKTCEPLTEKGKNLVILQAEKTESAFSVFLSMCRFGSPQRRQKQKYK